MMDCVLSECLVYLCSLNSHRGLRSIKDASVLIEEIILQGWVSDAINHLWKIPSCIMVTISM